MATIQRAKAVPMVKEWLKQNFEPKQGGCVAKREVYEAYVAFCQSASIQATNDATFGKIFRSTFPNVQVRRLVRRVKAKKWHYCEVTYRPGSSLADDHIDAVAGDNTYTADSTGARRRNSSPDAGSTPSRKRRLESPTPDDGNVDHDEESPVVRHRKSPRIEPYAQEEEGNRDHTTRSPSSSSSDTEPSDEEEEVSSHLPSLGTLTAPITEAHIYATTTTTTTNDAVSRLPPLLGESGFWKRDMDHGLLTSSNSFTSLLHSSSGFSLRPTMTESEKMLLVGVATGAIPFGPAKKRSTLSESITEVSSLTTSSAEVFFSYQPISMEPFIRVEPSSHVAIADREPASPASAASPAVASCSGATSPTPQARPDAPSPFEASLSLPVHRTQPSHPAMPHQPPYTPMGHWTNPHISLPQHYPSLSMTQSVVPYRQLPSVTPSLPLTIHPYPNLPHPRALLQQTAPQASASLPTASGHTGQDREMSPDSMEIFISHLLTDKSGEVMTLRPM